MGRDYKKVFPNVFSLVLLSPSFPETRAITFYTLKQNGDRVPTPRSHSMEAAETPFARLASRLGGGGDNLRSKFMNS